MGQILPQLVVLRVHPRGSACPSAPLRFCHLLMENSPMRRVSRALGRRTLRIRRARACI